MEATTYIDTQVEKIYNDKTLEFPLNMAMSSAWLLGNLKGINLKVLDVSKTSSISDFFVLASASNPTQMRAMADVITKQLSQNGATVISKEGFTNADWLLIDCADIIIHIFLESSRSVYDLDSLWREAKSIEIPSSYYFSSDDEGVKQEPEAKDFF